MAATLTAEVEIELLTLKERLREIYGPRLQKFLLYGSQARGGTGPDSDIDVAVILDGPIHAGDEIARTSQLRQRIDLDTEKLVSLLYLTPETLRNGKRLIYRNIRQDGTEL